MLSLKKPTRSQREFFEQTLLPQNVREALSFSARVGREEIRSLIPYWPNEALYLLFKIWRNDTDSQRAFLQEISQACAFEDSPITMKEVLQKWAQKLPDNDWSVGAGKLAQVSRAGQDEWQKRFAALAQKSIQHNPESVPHLIAYATMIGFSEFAKAYANHSEQPSIAIVIPDWFGNEEQHSIGYILNFQDQKVSIRPYSSTSLDQTPHIIEDTARTGNSITHVRDYWLEKTQREIPEERIFVVTDLRQPQK